MSVILDALKKLEREKALCRKGPVDIVPEITASRVHRPRYGRWKITVALACVAMVTAAATFLAMTFLSPRDVRPPVVASVQIETRETIPRPHPVKEQPVGNVTTEDNNSMRAAERSRKAAADATPSAPRGEAVSMRTPDESRIPAEKGDDPDRGVVEESSAFTVSGIAWQEDRAQSRAVVNGALSGEGTMVEGARIVRIYRDRVRFSQAGRKFDVYVAGTSRSGQAK